MKKGFVMVLGALALTACSEKPGYTITGTVSEADLNGEYVYLSVLGEEDMPIDSALVENDAFYFEGLQEKPIVASLTFADGVILEEKELGGGFDPFEPWFLLDNSSKLTVYLDDNSVVTGTSENNDLTTYMQLLDDIYEDHPELLEQLNSGDDAGISAAEDAIEALDAKAASVHKLYLKSHSNSPLAANAFFNFRYVLPVDLQQEIVSGAGDVFKAYPGIDKRIEHLAILDKVAIGKKFTDFEMPDTKGKNHLLSEYVGNGKVTLIDFWASWCPPCRRSIPHLREVYAANKDKGFEIVGVSLDRTKEAWEKGIADLQITWPQLSDVQYWKNAGAALYGVNSIPHTVLVDKDGTIIAKNLHGEALDAKLKEIL
ncbi:thiol:disulfide interchange protein [Bacteroidia bacterium]|nr:thiol:disulfide interchange protein [Bacteroidia bacterium]